jgi:glutamyl-tRNA reductase
MHIVCVGLSHHTASVALREKLAMDAQQVAAALAELSSQFDDAELALVSTCNRTETYVARPLHGHPRVEQLTDWLVQRTGEESQRVHQHLYHYDNDRAIRHLFQVTCGLDSMVLGEHQIVGQIRQAYELAQAAETAKRTLHRMFQLALATSKRVRQQTGVGDGRQSVGGAAVEYARHLFDSLADKTMLVIGAGKMAELTARQMQAMGPRDLIVINRTHATAQVMAASLGGRTMPFDELPDALAAADVVLTSTGAPEPIITVDAFAEIHKQRKYRPLFIIDLAVPRDVEAGVGDLPNVYRFDLDDLQASLDQHDVARHGAIEAATTIVEQAVGECYALVQTGDMSDLMRRLRRQMHRTGQQETQRTIGRLMAADADQFEQILDEHTQRLINKVLHRPLTELGRGDSRQAAMYATALRRLFGLDHEDLTLPESTRRDEAANSNESD